MESKTRLLFGIHMHQPVDNFKEVIDHAVDVCYAPFFEVVSSYPQFRFSVHCSGWLLEQIERDHPRLFKTMQKLAQQGTIEFFSAGFYEPILSTIPSADRVGQISKLNSYIKKHFGQKVKGMWLTERVWESALIPDLKSCGIDYTVIDDYHFQSAGFDEALLDGYYTTEEGGQPMAIFPISKSLRYAIPFMSVKDALKAVKSFDKRENSAAVIFDDAEKFGMWPGTYSWVYEKGWLKEFIEAVLEDASIVCEHYSTYYESQRSQGVAYLPNVSYYEMGEWSLAADDALALEKLQHEMGEERFAREGVKFLKGGIWKNFFVKYAESNRIHKRMLELSKLQSGIKESEFTECLYKLQTNDALWHGVFGGTYLPNLRDNAYRYLIECEAIRYRGQKVVETDESEMNGYEALKFVEENLLCRFDSRYGGQLVEFDLLDARFNWQNTLTRRKEFYHEKILHPPQAQDEKEEHLSDGIDTIHTMAYRTDEKVVEAMVYDWYIKNSFIDHISDKSVTLENFRRCSFKEYGDFANQPFDSGVEQGSLAFKRHGGIYLPQKHPATLTKSYRPKHDGFGFSIDFSTDFDYFFNYIVELNFHFAQYQRVTINTKGAQTQSSAQKVKEVEIIDGYLNKKIVITLDQYTDLLFYPVMTVSQSEQGFDLTQQAVCIGLVFPFTKQFILEGRLEVKDV